LTSKAGTAGSTLVLGGYDPKYMQAGQTFKYYPVAMEMWWVLKSSGVNFNGTKFDLDNVIVDTGTSVLVGSKSIVSKITKHLPLSPDCSKISTYPNIEFMFGSDTYVIEPKDYILEVTAGGESQCVLGIQGMELPDQLGKAFILGDTFIHKYYTHFDMGNKQIGFALAK